MMRIAGGTISEVNIAFYKEYDPEYFFNKGVLLCQIISDPKSTKEQLQNGFRFRKVSVSEPKITQKWLTAYAKRELVVNSYHCVESFFRLFFAHVEEPECPWVGVEQLHSFAKFHGKIDKLLQRKYFKSDHNASIVVMLLGNRDMYPHLSDKQWETNIERAVELIDRLGADILHHQDYNSYKHGHALFNTAFGFKLGNEEAILGVKKQDSFMYLTSTTEKTPEKVIKQFSRTFKFMKWEQRFASTVLAGQLISNLIVLKKAQLGMATKRDRLYAFYPYNFHKILGTGISVDTVSELLFGREYSVDTKSKRDINA